LRFAFTARRLPRFAAFFAFFLAAIWNHSELGWGTRVAAARRSLSR
jgi:hypothetical protein